MIPQNNSVYILSAVRTPIGKFNGSLSSVKVNDLGSLVIKETIVRASVSSEDVSEVIMGQVITGGQGQNPARQASLNAGLSATIPAYTVNMVCGSGLKSLVLGFHSIKCEDSSIVVCGGQENMSRAHHSCYMRPGLKMGPATFQDTMMVDSLIDPIHNVHMGITAENLAKKYKVSRQSQDEFALKSQVKAENAIKEGLFKTEIVPVSLPLKGSSVKLFDEDEHLRKGTTYEALSKLPPCFIKDGTGTVTAGNAAGINDGAAALVLCSQSEVQKRDLKPLAYVVSWGQEGVDPLIMGYGPVPAIRSALKKAKWSTDDVDLWEINEAFAAQSLVVLQELGIDEEKVNVCGGAIALGHPVGASGARILVTLIHNLKRLGKRKGVAASCIGGGMGIAVCIQMCD